jgi:hypothetical protein
MAETISGQCRITNKKSGERIADCVVTLHTETGSLMRDTDGTIDLDTTTLSRLWRDRTELLLTFENGQVWSCYVTNPTGEITATPVKGGTT